MQDIIFFMNQSIWDLIRQLFRFGMVGGLATVVNSALFLIFVDIFKVVPLLSNLLAFLCAFLVSYFGHSWWTFGHRKHSSEKLARFLMTSLLGLAINSCFIWILMHQLHQSAYVAIIPMIFMTPLLIFCINKSWVFKAQHS
jgi:putative flippase GtrA